MFTVVVLVVVVVVVVVIIIIIFPAMDIHRSPVITRVSGEGL
jgi:hypothetical protein